MLCVSVIALPTTALAASDADTTPPTLTATLDGDTLHIAAADNPSGVAAVLIDGTRVNVLSDGAADVLLKNYPQYGDRRICHTGDLLSQSPNAGCVLCF